MTEPVTVASIAHQRLCNQQLIAPRFGTAAEVVGWLGAVQAQDVDGAKWALGQRLAGVTSEDIDQAFAEGTILRTHVLRPTWHFVTPADIRWMLALTGPRVQRSCASYYRKLELDETILDRSNTILIQALQGGKHLTRDELRAALEDAGITTNDLRSSFLMMHAELEGVICSGARRGKQFTYALLDERAPQGPSFTRDEAVVELVRRYVQSHGPVLVQDFVWWSGLNAADCRAGLEALRSELLSETIDGKHYWFAPTSLSAPASTPTAYLLPNYDESMGSYRDRSIAVDEQLATLQRGEHRLFPHMLVIDGRLVGMWRRTVKKTILTITLQLFRPLSDVEMEAVKQAAARYSAFLGISVVVDECIPDMLVVHFPEKGMGV